MKWRIFVHLAEFQRPQLKGKSGLDEHSSISMYCTYQQYVAELVEGRSFRNLALISNMLKFCDIFEVIVCLSCNWKTLTKNEIEAAVIQDFG